MEKNIATLNEKNFELNLSEVANALRLPVELLRKYYAKVLERELSMRQTWLLINVQAAFVFAAVPVDGPWLLRIACCGWLLHALLKCKSEL